MTKKKSTSPPAGNRYKLVGLRLNDALRQAAQDLATAERRSLAQMCSILIEEALQARKEKE
jgi:hypothetical protein